jgi:dolichol-phosphate mannosyltransferase
MAPEATSPRRLDDGTLVSIVIPCFNEEEVLSLLYTRLTAVAEQLGARYEVVLIDDGSTDRTWELLAGFHHRDPRWKLLRLARNFGHQVALWAGLKHATGDVIAVLDADLQDPPEILPQFLAQWVAGYDVIYAIRQKRKEGPFKRLAYYAYYRILAFLSEIEIPLDAGDFGVIDRRVLAAMTATHEPGPFIRGLRAWVGFRQIGLAYEREQRAAGQAKYTFRKLVELALNGILSFSTRPLRLATYLGLIVSATAFAGAVFTFLQRIFAKQFAHIGLEPVPGFATIVIAILFLGGVQLLCLGILGEYVGRIYQNVLGRPLPTISARCGLSAHDGTSRATARVAPAGTNTTGNAVE